MLMSVQIVFELDLNAVTIEQDMDIDKSRFHRKK